MSSTASLSSASPVARPRLRTALLLVAGIAVAAGANAIVATTALAVGADPAFRPLTPALFISFGAAGLLAGYIGWRAIRRFVPNPRRALTIIVPIALVLSWVPDVVLMATGFILGASVTGVVGLMLMHPIVVAVGVPLYQRVAPVR